MNFVQNEDLPKVISGKIDRMEGSQSGKIAQFYDNCGKNILSSKSNVFLSRFNNFLTAGPVACLEKSLPIPKAGQAVTLLDLCCGTGIHSIYPASLGYRVTAVDLSPQSVQAACWLARENNVDGLIEFHVGEVESWLKANNCKFDVIIVAGSLYYLDLDTILPLICSHLKDGGIFLSTETNGDNFLMNAFRRFKNRRNSYRDERTLSHLLRASDYRKVRSYFKESVTINLDFLSLGVLPFSGFGSIAEKLYGFLCVADGLFLRLPFFRRLSFKVFFFGKK